MGGVLNGVQRAVVRLATIANMIGTGVIFVLVAIMNTDVVARGVFHLPFRGVVEVVIFSLVLIVFLQLPSVVHGNRLTRSDGFLAIMRQRRPQTGRIVSRLIDAVAGIFMAIVTWAIWPEFLDSFESCHFFTQPEFGPAPSGDLLADLSAAIARCDYFGTPGIFTAPWWPARLAIVFGVGLSAVILILKAVLGDEHAETGTGP